MPPEEEGPWLSTPSSAPQRRQERGFPRGEPDRGRDLQDARRAGGAAVAGGAALRAPRRTVGLFLGPIVLAVMLLIPFDLDGNQHRLAAILAFVVVWWVTEAIPIPMTALLGVVAVRAARSHAAAARGRQLGRRRLRPVHRRHGDAVHRQLHHRPGDGRARPAPPARLPRAVAVLGGRQHLPDHPGLRADRGDHLAGHVEHRRRGDDAADRARRDGRGGRHGGQAGRAASTASSGCASAPR